MLRNVVGVITGDCIIECRSEIMHFPGKDVCLSSTQNAICRHMDVDGYAFNLNIPQY